MSHLSKAMHEQKLAHWKQIIIDCRTSGLTSVEYMRIHGIRPSAFYYWLRQVREELLEEHPEFLHQPKPSKELAVASPEVIGAPEQYPASENSVACATAPLQPTAAAPAAPPQDFVAVRVASPLPRDKLMVSCGPFRFELTEDTPPSLLRKLAAAWRGSP